MLTPNEEKTLNNAIAIMQRIVKEGGVLTRVKPTAPTKKEIDKARDIINQREIRRNK